MRLLTRSIGIVAVLFCATSVARGRVVISLDFSLDQGGGLFDSRTVSGQQAQAAMQRAAYALSDRLVDPLTAITPGGSNTWMPRVNSPASGQDVNAPLPSLPANVIKVYVGSRTFALGTESASAVAGTATAGGAAVFIDNANSRGQAGALATPRTDYGPWGGSIAFDDGTPWYYGLTPGGLTSGKVDFLSVATHELTHLLGFSISQGSYAALVSATSKFVGAKATAVNGGASPAVVGSHWVGVSSPVGINGPSQTAMMDASLPAGTRRRMTLVDWAALDDLGWDVALPGDANADGVVGFSDYQLLERGFRSTNARWAQGDFNEDGVVNAADVSILLQNYGRRLDGSMAAVSVSEQQALAAFARSVGAEAPEPGGLAVVAAGLAFVVGWRPRR
jgi:hypothetical protein